MLSAFHKTLRICYVARAWRPANASLLIGALPGRQRNSQAGFSDDDHLEAAIGWLERAQDASGDGGVAGRYRLASGWSSSYPETTGYIIPTLLRLAEELDQQMFRERADRAMNFLLKVQLPEGGFPGLEIAQNRTEPSIFNTAQILCGLRSFYRASGDPAVLAAARRSADWLVSQQDEDGAWRRFLYGNVTYTYMAHAACWLAEFGGDLGDERYLLAARRHLDWVMSHRDPSTGWFDHCDFYEQDQRLRRSVTHTLAYTLWGVLLISQVLNDPAGIDAVRQASLGIARRLELSGWLPGKLDHRWEGQADYACLTGNAQLALIWLELHRLEACPVLLNAACKALDLVKAAQPMSSSDPGIQGGIPGSDPPWGAYLRLALPNWSVKFFIDGLLAKRAALADQSVAPQLARLNGADLSEQRASGFT